MQIISNKRLHFEDTEYNKNKDGELTSNVKDAIIVNPSVHAQIVPDWVRATDLFKLSVDDGSVSEVSILSNNSKPLKSISNEPKEIKAVKEAVIVKATGAPDKPVVNGWATNESKPEDTGFTK